LGNSNYQVTMDTYAHMIPALRNEVVETEWTKSSRLRSAKLSNRRRRLL